MRFRVLPVLLLTGAVAAADTSPRSTFVDPARFELVQSFAAPRVSILSPAGQFSATYRGNQIVVVDTLNGRETGTLDGHTNNIHDGHFSRDGRLIATASYDGTVRIWDTRTRKEVRSIQAHAGYA